MPQNFVVDAGLHNLWTVSYHMHSIGLVVIYIIFIAG
jgi:hypothetical protein